MSNVLIFFTITIAIVWAIAIVLGLIDGPEQYKSTLFLKKVAKRRDYYCAKFLPSIIEEREKQDPDMFWKEWEENASFWVKNTYRIWYASCMLLWFLGTITIFAVLESAEIAGVFFISFSLTNLRLARLFDYHGKFKRHVLNSRFERDVDMATKSTSDIYRGSGVLVLKQIFATWNQSYSIGGTEYRNKKLSDMSGYSISETFSYDDLISANKIILKYLIFNNFRMTERELQNACRELYTKSRMSYGKGCDKENEYVKSLYGMTHESDVNEDALRFWESIVASNRKEAGNSLIEGGIYSDKVISDESSFFIFFEIDLGGIKFLVKLDNGEVDFPTPDACVNFRESCFIEIAMHKTSVDHVDFTCSNLFRINDERKEQIDYEMSCIGTIFDEANLIDCNFGRADFKDASFVGTNISGSDFRHARNLTKKQLEEGAYWIRPGRPQFPKGWTDDFADTLPNSPTSPT